MGKPNCPGLTVDIIAVRKVAIRTASTIEELILIERKNEPYGWALPGGFVDVGETTRQAASRELQEETGIIVPPEQMALHSVYDDPNRDPRHHNVTIVYYCHFEGTPVAADDAKNIGVYPVNALPELTFDHAKILQDFFG